MDHQTSPGGKLPESPRRIWLAPACQIDERPWCEDDLGCCDECGENCVKNIRADTVAGLSAEAEGARSDGLLALRDCVAPLEALTAERPALAGKIAGNTTVGNVIAAARSAAAKMAG